MRYEVRSLIALNDSVSDPPSSLLSMLFLRGYQRRGEQLG